MCHSMNMRRQPQPPPVAEGSAPAGPAGLDEVDARVSNVRDPQLRIAFALVHEGANGVGANGVGAFSRNVGIFRIFRNFQDFEK